jgi:hypothetical protein
MAPTIFHIVFPYLVHDPALPVIQIEYKLVRDDPKLLDDGGEIPKPQERGWHIELWL